MVSIDNSKYKLYWFEYWILISFIEKRNKEAIIKSVCSKSFYTYLYCFDWLRDLVGWKKGVLCLKVRQIILPPSLSRIKFTLSHFTRYDSSMKYFVAFLIVSFSAMSHAETAKFSRGSCVLFMDASYGLCTGRTTDVRFLFIKESFNYEIKILECASGYGEGKNIAAYEDQLSSCHPKKK